jgi:predicted RNA-binding protein with PIN domain
MPALYLVDGFNLLHAVLLRGPERTAPWWRVAWQERVVRLADAFGAGEVCVVFDLRRDEPSSSTLSPGAFECCSGTERVQVRFAPSADDFIVNWCAELGSVAGSRREVIVVSADRALLDRARARGAGRLSPWQFAEQCGSSIGACELQPRGKDMRGIHGS